MATNYPGSLDSWSNPGSSTTMDQSGFFHDEVHTNTNDAIEAIEGELGTNPKGGQATVKARLDLAALSMSTWRYWPSAGYISNARGTGNMTSSASSMTADVTYFLPWWCSQTVTLDRIGIEVTTAQATSHVRVGLYGSGTAGIPGSLVATLGVVDSATTGIKELTISQSVTAGTLYWVAVQNEITGLVLRGLSQSEQSPFHLSSPATASNTTLWQSGTTYGSGLATVGSLSVDQSGQFLFWMRRT